MVDVLHLLRKFRGQWLGMETLQSTLSLPPATIHDQIGQLRELGYDIEAVPARGFRLTGEGGILTAELITHGLGTQRVGREVLVYDSTDSTNDVAWHYAREGGYDGLAVLAEYQRVGRGRLGRAWLAEPGSSILCSVLLQEAEGLGAQALTLLAGVSVAAAVAENCGVRTSIKWPNDVTADGRKLAGIMVESRKIDGNYRYVIGTGINCRQEEGDFTGELAGRAVSLRQLTGRCVDRVELVQAILRQMDDWIEQVTAGKGDKLHDAWVARCNDVGRRIAIRSDGEQFAGRVIDISVEKGLLVQLDGGGVKMFDGASSTVPS